jgi:hypothetical protein
MKNTNTIDCPKKNFTNLQERRKFPSFCHRAGRIRKLRKKMQVARSQKTSIVHWLVPPKNRVITFSISSKTESNESAQIV